MSVQDGYLPTGRRVPQSSRLVLGSRDDTRASIVERRDRYGIAMPSQDRYLIAGRSLPDARVLSSDIVRIRDEGACGCGQHGSRRWRG